MSILRKIANFPDPVMDRQIVDMVNAINRLAAGDIGAEVAGVAADLDAQHLVDFAHGDIAHANRTALNAVQGVNTGDQDLTYLEEGIADAVADIGTVAGELAGHISDTDNPHVVTLDQATEQGANSTRLFSCGGKVAFTPEGGLAVKLTNKTGAASVRGTVLTMSDGYDNAFELQTAEFDGVAVCYETGVADGSEAWCVVSGIAEVLLKDGTAATHGSWTKCADTDGRAEVTTPPTGIGALAVSEHFKEIGHCIEDKASGTDVLAKIVLHFN